MFSVNLTFSALYSLQNSVKSSCRFARRFLQVLSKKDFHGKAKYD